MKALIKPPISYYGGKQNLLKDILPLIRHDLKLYCEPFLGGGAVFWSKKPHRIEVLNDLNGEVVNFYQVLQGSFEDLQELIRTTPHSRRIHEQANVVYSYPEMFDQIRRAWAFWVLCNQGFSSGIGKGWAYARKEPSCERKSKNARMRFEDSYRTRLDQVQIECNDALKVIRSRDSEDTFFYCDPPYFNSDCGHYSGYSEADFEELLNTLSNIKGKFLLSSYPCGLLSHHTSKHGWDRIEIRKCIAVSHKTKREKVEVLTANYCTDGMVLNSR